MFSASYFQMLSEYYSILKDTHYISNSSSITDHTDATKLGSYAWVRAQIGSENRKVYFPARSTPYIFPDDYTTSTYTEISLLPGAMISVPAGKTLTIHKFDAASCGDRQCFSGDGTIAFADGAVSWINSAWFPGGDTDAGVIFARGNIPIWIKADGSVEANGLSISVPDATTEVKGISELATDAEAQAKTATDKVLVPNNIPEIMASPGDIGGTTPGKVYATNLYLDGEAVGDTPTEILKWRTGSLSLGAGAKYGSGAFQDIMAIGYEAMGAGNTVGDRIVAVGSYALWSNTSADYKTAVGAYAASSATSGADLVAVGTQAGNYNQTGSHNTYVGSQAGYGASGQSHSDNTFVGYRSGYAITTGGNNCIYGSSAGVALTTGASNVLIGKDNGNTLTTQSYNTSVGAISLYNSTGGSNTVVGYNSAVNVSGSNNLALGVQTLTANTAVSGSSNIAIGDGAISPPAADVSGSGNLCVGINAGDYLSTGNNNTVLGREAGKTIQGVSSAVLVGAYAASNIAASGADGEVAIGFEAEHYNSSGARNTSVGYQAGKGATGNNHNDNSLFGYQAGVSLTTGSTNTLIGSKAGDSITSGSGNIIIGYDQDASAATANNEINIGGLIYGDNDTATAGISIAAPLAKWHTVGTGANRMMTSAIGKGGWTEGVAEAAADITASASVTIQVDIPTNAKIRGCQLRVDAALAAGELWDAKFNDGSDVETITTAAAVAKNTKINFFSSLTTDAETDIVITKNGGGSFTAQGTIRAVVYYEYLYAMGDAA